eukprot:comp20067_c0_seq1/m.24684 comp20067_c0_seq1/g.24684  ORF comp20067_c0_seq1/g.24684 comp20067_c0_seq1/m.24684 type:complete len:477 (-) comp20067_c0_seq1:360-1790(-)
MATMNINSNVTDAFYRYKMPKLVAKVEGKGNGIKTVIVNMDDIGKALNRPATYPTKFFGCELGAQTQMDEKNARFIVNGAHDAKDLQELLDKFIKKYVLCPQCENPETDMRVSSQGIIKAKCVACGWRGEMDNNHRLATFITRNPPNNAQSISQAADKKKERKSKKEKEAAEAKGEGKEAKPEKEKSKKSKSEKGEKGTKSAEASPPPSKKEKEKEKRAPKDEDEDEEEDDDVDWSLDVSEEAVRARREALEEDLGDAVKGMTLTEADYMDMSEKDRLEAFKTFCQKTHSDKELLDEAVRLGIRDKAMAVLAELKFNEGLLQQLKQNRALLVRFCDKDPETQRCLLGAIERLTSVLYPSLLAKVAHIIKALYDLDIVEEEVLVEWGDQTTSKYVSGENFKKVVAQARKVLDWLKEAESDDDDEDDDLAFSSKGAADISSAAASSRLPSVPSAGAAKAAPAAAAAEDDDDDLDIDNI